MSFMLSGGILPPRKDNKKTYKYANISYEKTKKYLQIFFI
jgi:hypothetical protein